MPNGQTLLCRTRVTLVASAGTSFLWADLSKFFPTTGVTKIRGRLVVCEGTGFQAKVGIQTYAADIELPTAPVAPATAGTGLGVVAPGTKQFVEFDPTVANNGNITQFAGFRVGVWYQSTSATITRGEVILELWCDA